MSNDDLEPGDRFLDYIVKGCLGEGGMGTVYEAVEEFSGSAVAIKCLRGCFTGREDFVLRLKQESKFYSKLRHPNIVRMNRAGITDDGRVFIVMERLIGRTLRSILDRTNRLDFLNSVHVLLQIAEAIGAAHEAGIWHRDLKPENVMIGTRGGERGHVWVLDFGIASDGAANTDELPRLGTYRYLSPEQVRGLKPDGRADIYAFGIIAYEMLTGRHTFLGKRTDATAAEIASGHLFAEAPQPVHELVPDCPEPLWPILERCLEKDREKRYASFDAVVDDLRALIRSSVPPEHVLAKRVRQENLVAARRTAFDSLAEAEEEAEENEVRVDVKMTAAAGATTRGRMGMHGTEPLVGFGPPARTRHHATEPLEGFIVPSNVLPFLSRAARAPQGEGFTEEMPKSSPQPPGLMPTAPLASMAPAVRHASRVSLVTPLALAPVQRRPRRATSSLAMALLSGLVLMLSATAVGLTVRASQREKPPALESAVMEAPPTEPAAATATATATATEPAAATAEIAAAPTATASASIAIVAPTATPTATTNPGKTQKTVQKTVKKPAASSSGGSISVLLVPTFEIKETPTPKRKP